MAEEAQAGEPKNEEAQQRTQRYIRQEKNLEENGGPRLNLADIFAGALVGLLEKIQIPIRVEIQAAFLAHTALGLLMPTVRTAMKEDEVALGAKLHSSRICGAALGALHTARIKR
jgi:hypothetical protein